MNKFKKKTRSKMIAASIAILSSAAVVSTGFAAWVISGGDSTKVSGTITADTVSNKYHTIKLDSQNTAIINFGAPTLSEGESTSGAWLTNDAMGKESLLAEFQFTVGNIQTEDEATPAKLFSSITLSATDDTNYQAAVTDKLVSALPNSWKKNAYDVKPEYNSKTAMNGSAAGIYLVKNSTTVTAEKTLSFTLYIQFTWGEKFGYKNPYYFYNAADKTAASYGSEANTNLGMVTNIKDANFALTITAQ